MVLPEVLVVAAMAAMVLLALEHLVVALAHWEFLLLEGLPLRPLPEVGLAVALMHLLLHKLDQQEALT